MAAEQGPGGIFPSYWHRLRCRLNFRWWHGTAVSSWQRESGASVSYRRLRFTFHQRLYVIPNSVDSADHSRTLGEFCWLRFHLEYTRSCEEWTTFNSTGSRLFGFRLRIDGGRGLGLLCFSQTFGVRFGDSSWCEAGLGWYRSSLCRTIKIQSQSLNWFQLPRKPNWWKPPYSVFNASLKLHKYFKS